MSSIKPSRPFIAFSSLIFLVFALVACSPPPQQELNGESRALVVDDNTERGTESHKPASRVIVQFTHPITPEQQASIKRLISDHGIAVLALAESSNEQRWILQLPPDFAGENMQPLIDDLSALPFVDYAEPDRLLAPLR